MKLLLSGVELVADGKHHEAGKNVGDGLRAPGGRDDVGVGFLLVEKVESLDPEVPVVVEVIAQVDVDDALRGIEISVGGAADDHIVHIGEERQSVR